jgi:hypothetical protein
LAQVPFSAQLVAKLPGKATCVEGWHRTAESHRLLVGLADGTLLVLASDEQAAQGRDIQGEAICSSFRTSAALSYAE